MSVTDGVNGNGRSARWASRQSRIDRADPRGAAAALKDVDTKLLNIELVLLSKSDFFSDDKYYVEPFHVYLNLIWLSGEIGTGAGDVAGGADYAPTETSRNLLEMIEKDLAAATAEYRGGHGKVVAPHAPEAFVVTGRKR